MNIYIYVYIHGQAAGMAEKVSALELDTLSFLLDVGFTPMRPPRTDIQLKTSMKSIS